MNCSASAMAVSALRRSIEELIPLESDNYLPLLDNLMPEEHKVNTKSVSIFSLYYHRKRGWSEIFTGDVGGDREVS